jgi:hypothetical protein
MAHGRNQSSRSKNAPDTDAWATNLFSSSGRKRGAPPEGLAGPYTARRLPTGGTASLQERETAPEGGGSEVAPTPRAVAREKERHARERAMGRVAAGTMAKQRAALSSAVKRADLERAAREADSKVSEAAKPPRKRQPAPKRARR